MTTFPNSFTKKELIECGYGELFGKGNPQLPIENMLMFDRIIQINNDGGNFNKGFIHAELDINPNLWFFKCHFPGDPVMPGCLGLDALWQLIGFFLGWKGNKGQGRALGCSEVKFSGQVTPESKLVSYELHITRVIERKLTMGIANASMKVDGKEIYTGKDLRVGLFQKADIL